MIIKFDESTIRKVKNRQENRIIKKFVTEKQFSELKEMLSIAAQKAYEAEDMDSLRLTALALKGYGMPSYVETAFSLYEHIPAGTKVTGECKVIPFDKR